MRSWIRRILRLPDHNGTTQHAIEQAESIESTANELRTTMLQETRASARAQQKIREEMKVNWLEDELLRRIRPGGDEHA